MKTFLPMLAAVAMWSCTNSTESNSGDPPNYNVLIGTWAAQDASMSLNIHQVCCGGKPQIFGAFTLGSKSFDLDPLSQVETIEVIKPDSGSSPVHVYELFLPLKNPAGDSGSICGFDGFVQDSTGQKEFASSMLSPPFHLTLSEGHLKGTECEFTHQAAVDLSRSP